MEKGMSANCRDSERAAGVALLPKPSREEKRHNDESSDAREGGK